MKAKIINNQLVYATNYEGNVSNPTDSYLTTLGFKDVITSYEDEASLTEDKNFIYNVVKKHVEPIKSQSEIRYEIYENQPRIMWEESLITCDKALSIIASLRERDKVDKASELKHLWKIEFEKIQIENTYVIKL